jgi:hypothetical protein
MPAVRPPGCQTDEGTVASFEPSWNELDSDGYLSHHAEAKGIRIMVAIPRTLKVAVGLILVLAGFVAAASLVIVVYHWFFGTLGGNL